MKTLTVNDDQSYFALRCFFSKSGIDQYVIDRYNQENKLIIRQKLLSKQQHQMFLLHLKYHKFFTWGKSGLEDVIFWEHPELFPAMLEDFKILTRDLEYQYLAPVEARGFLMGGLLSSWLGLPQYLIRKYKPSFDNFPGIKVDYVNWKKEDEMLFVFDRKIKGKTVLIVDDLLDTGNSLKASVNALGKLEVNVGGVFYLADGRISIDDGEFDFPVISLVKIGVV